MRGLDCVVVWVTSAGRGSGRRRFALLYSANGACFSTEGLVSGISLFSISMIFSYFLWQREGSSVGCGALNDASSCVKMSVSTRIVDIIRCTVLSACALRSFSVSLRCARCIYRLRCTCRSRCTALRLFAQLSVLRCIQPRWVHLPLWVHLSRWVHLPL